MRVRLVAGLIAALVLVSGCGGGDSSELTAPPAEVPVALVPPKLETSKLQLAEDGPATEAFTKVGPKALVADGRLWQLRQDDGKLVGTLQMSTLKSKVQITEAKQRRSIVNSILPGAKQEIQIAGVDVVTSQSNDKTLYVWFASDLFEVLQLKGTRIDPEAIASELLAFQTASPGWRPLPPFGSPQP